jgi:hypothetical protein
LLPAYPTTAIGSFPQTEEIRIARAAHAKGSLSSADYMCWSSVGSSGCGSLIVTKISVSGYGFILSILVLNFAAAKAANYSLSAASIICLAAASLQFPAFAINLAHYRYPWPSAASLRLAELKRIAISSSKALSRICLSSSTAYASAIAWRMALNFTGRWVFRRSSTD